MAFENLDAHTINLCGNCVGHVAYGDGEWSCCHEDRRPADTERCPTGVKLWRRQADAVDITLGCLEEECQNDCDRSGEDTTTWYGTCAGCGEEYVDVQHATAWVTRRPAPRTVVLRSGWTLEIHRGAMGGASRSLWTVATRPDDDGQWADFGGAYDGSGRYERLARWVATLPA